MVFLPVSIAVKMDEAALRGASKTLRRALRHVNIRRKREGLVALDAVTTCEELTPEDVIRLASLDLEDLMTSFVSPEPVLRSPVISKLCMSHSSARTFH